MKMSFAHDIGVVASACILSIGVNWKTFEEQGKTLKKHQNIIQDQGNIIERQGERLTSLEGALAGDNDRAQSSRALQTVDSPFQRDANNNWLTVDKSALFIFTKGIVVGEMNEACVYGNAVLSVETASDSVEAGYGNCPSSDGSVTFGGHNLASGVMSAVTGGRYNEASGVGSAVTGGLFNTASSDYSTVTGGRDNQASNVYSSVTGGNANHASNYCSSVTGGTNNVASGMYSSVTGGGQNKAQGGTSSISGGYNNGIYPETRYGSILGGYNHEIKTSYGTSALLSLNSTNSTYGQMIPNHHPEERIRSLEDHSPFNCTETLCTSEDKRFLFTEGVVIGKINPRCGYGSGTLSVDFGNQKKGTNCPKKRGSVTFGRFSTTNKTASFKYNRRKD